MNIDESISVLESVLFASGEPVEKGRLAYACAVEYEIIDKLAGLLNDRYENIKSSLVVMKLENSYQLAVKSQYFDYIKLALESKKNAPLSPAALEVLTIIAYNQPVTKGFVEHIRGIDSSSVVNSLVEKKLLEEAGRLDVPGKPIAYKTTDAFLRCFQLSSVEELPKISSDDPQVSFDELLITEEINESELLTAEE